MKHGAISLWHFLCSNSHGKVKFGREGNGKAGAVSSYLLKVKLESHFRYKKKVSFSAEYGNTN